MNQLVASVLLLSALLICSLRNGLAEAIGESEELAKFPPRGWNSYDSFSWVVDESAFLDNAQVMSQRLLQYGFEYVVVDFLWFRKTDKRAPFDPYGNDLIDDWGRLYPDPEKWPSSLDGKGFTQVATKVHEMGLKFGLHCMRGMSTLTFNLDKPILDVNTGKAYWESGRYWSAKDIGLPNKACAWMPHGFLSVNTDIGAGRAFLRSLYHQYAEWGVDFVKLDCVFGVDFDANEIITVSEILAELDRPVLLSISPGVHATPTMAKSISKYVNMYRITGDDWDTWEDVAAHFDISRDMAASGLIGAEGFHGRSWPDLDMLPLGWLSDPGVPKEPHRKCRLSSDEQRTQMTLWSMAKSPLIFGGDLRNIDDWTFSLITHPVLLEINSYSTNNMEIKSSSSISDVGIIQLPVSGTTSLAHGLTGQELPNASKNKLVGLTICSSDEAKGWFNATADGYQPRICQSSNTGIEKNMTYCVYQKQSFLKLDEDRVYKKKDMGKFQLQKPEACHLCLDASIRRKPTASISGSILSSTCKWQGSQLWRLNSNGTLVNSYSGLCATVQSNKGTIRGTRSWIATGRKGEIYLSYFNLNSESEVISQDISDISNHVEPRFSFRGPCNTTEVWSGLQCGLVNEISARVPAHGVALFMLQCQDFQIISL